MKKNRLYRPFYSGYAFPWKIWKWPSHFYNETRDFIERGLYGYSRSDTWSLKDYLASWMPEALRQMEREGGKIVDFSYNQIDLEKIAKGFEAARKQDEDWLKWDDFEPTRKEGMDHFVDKFHGLWW